MKTHQVIHRVALVALTVVAAGSFYGTLSNPIADPVSRALAPIVGIVLWGFLIWKVGTRPRQWGMGMGIFLLLMIAFQTYLFRLALAKPALVAMHPDDAKWSHFLVFAELPILIAAVSCILLRFTWPTPGSDAR